MIENKEGRGLWKSRRKRRKEGKKGRKKYRKQNFKKESSKEILLFPRGCADR